MPYSGVGANTTALVSRPKLLQPFCLVVMKRTHVGVVLACLALAACGGKVGRGGPDELEATTAGLGGAVNTSAVNTSGSAASTTTGAVDPPATTGTAPPPDVPPPDIDPPDVPIPVLPANCYGSTQSIGDGYCDMLLECERGSVATFCETSGTDSMSCQCDANPEVIEFEVTGASEYSACPLTARLCLEGSMGPEYSAPMCDGVSGQVGTDYCVQDEVCTQTATLSPQVTAISTTERRSRCQATASDSWDCSCDSRDYFHINFPGNSELDMCATAADLCVGRQLELPGEVSCDDAVGMTVSDDGCQANLDCTQSGSVEGAPVTLSWVENLLCRVADAGLWSCLCGANPFDVEVNTEDPDAACETAARSCATLLQNQ